MAKKLSDVIPAEFFINFGGHKVTLRWNNRSIAFAEQYAEFLGYKISGDELIQLAANGKAIAISSFLFGAMKAANKKVTPYQFYRNFKIDDIAAYIKAVEKGLTKILPEKNSSSEYEENSDETKKKRTRKTK